jgi:hypothetical protein
MGYMLCYGCCVNCHQPFSFNPERVPSVRVQGVREPVCRNCIEHANRIRKERGLEEFSIMPGAYEPEECA